MGGSDELMTRSRAVACSRDDEMCGAVRAPDCNGIPCGAGDAVLHGPVAGAVQPTRGAVGWYMLGRFWPERIAQIAQRSALFPRICDG